MVDRSMEVVMPKVGLTMTEGTLTRWHKQPGDAVAKGDLLFTFETEKSTLEYESPDSGVLTRILVTQGETVACFAPVAILGDGAAVAREAHGMQTTATPKSSAPVPDPSINTQPDADAGAGTAPNSTTRRPASPRAKQRAKALGLDLTHINGTGVDGAIRERDVLAHLATQVSRPAQTTRATPVAQRLAQERGIDLSTLQGSGIDGKITREDVERVVTMIAGEANPAKDVYAADFQPLSAIRRVTAQRMVANVQAAPHVTLHTEVDATELTNARTQLNAELKQKLSYNALLIAVCAKALKEHPAVCASWVDGDQDGERKRHGVLTHSHINIGIAVDTPRGLLVPVLHRCESKSLTDIHRALTDLIEQTLAGKASPDVLSGGTFTITNLGMFEIDGFTPIINLPEAAILGVGRLVKKPVVRNDDEIVVRQMMTLSLSFDHRVVDGAPAAKFLQRVKQLIERPFALLI
jgi:pyruvate dehydrogenase E2 component (dihydrolipoamide acetyltransferase)